MALRTRQPETDVPGTRLLLGLEGASGDSVTVQPYALDEVTANGPVADRRFYEIAAATAVAVGDLVEIATRVPNIGASGNPVYFRLTVNGLSAEATLKAACTV